MKDKPSLVYSGSQ